MFYRFFSRFLGKEPKQRRPDHGSPNHAISPRLIENQRQIKNSLRDCDDLICKDLSLGEAGHHAWIVFFEYISENKKIADDILRPLLLEMGQTRSTKGTAREFWQKIQSSVTPFLDMNEESQMSRALEALLDGGTLLFLEGIDKTLILDAKLLTHRAITEPSSEALIRGPRDGFVEQLGINISLIRRRFRDPNLKIKIKRSGLRTRTAIAIIYIDEIVHPGLLQEVNKRLDGINMDAILDSGYIEQMVEDSWLSPFPQIQSTERPDEVAAAVLEGRVAILADNSPFALLAPATLNSMMHSPEDYYQRWVLGSFVRLVRFVSSFIAVTLPALYIALTTYHPQMMPQGLALSIAGSREGVPFPPFLEALAMEVAIELLREAGVRLPGAIGQTVGIVGGLIIGEAAVQAGIVSPIMVVVVALTAISSFSIPTYDLAIAFRIVRFLLMLTAAILGLYGIMLGLMILLTHLATLKSFGFGYLSPWSPASPQDLRDTLFRAPWPAMRQRPAFMRPKESQRIAGVQKNSSQTTSARRRRPR